MHPAGLDMTRESLRDILDGNEVNVSTALPSVPQDTTNPFINPNQTLADVIPGRDLGPLSSLKITDADLIIRNLNKELNAAAEKNDNSVALLQRMDQRQKQLETELATLRAEKEAAIQERAGPYNKSGKARRKHPTILKRNMPTKNKTTSGN